MRILFRLGIAVYLTSVPLLSAESREKIGVLLKGRSTFWAAVEKGARDAGSRDGVDVVVKMPNSESDIGVQLQLLNSFASQGISAIVIAPTSKETLAGPLAALIAKGTKVVVADTAVPDLANSVFVGTDHVAAGKAAGELFANLVSDTDEVCFLKHNQTSGASIEREKGVMAAFRALRPKNIVHADIYASAEQGGEVQKAQLVLGQYPHVKAILATGSPGTLAMLRVLQEKNLAGSIKLVGFGFDLTPEAATAIEQGALAGWIAQLPERIGAQGVDAAVRLLKGETVPATINTDFIVITPANLHTPKVQALLTP